MENQQTIVEKYIEQIKKTWKESKRINQFD